MEPVEIAAGRLQLRPWSPYDEQELLAALQDPEIAHWTTVPSPYTRADAQAFLSESHWAGGVADWAVRDAVTGSLVGSIALRFGATDPSVGFWTAAPFRGQGLTTEALGAVCRFGFGALGLERITWAAEVGNWASRAVAQKCGFAVEGVRRAGLRHRGRAVDAWVGSLLATDPMTDTRPLPRPPVLSDGVVTLRGWLPSDAADVARACDDAVTARWLPVPSPYTEADGAFYVGTVVCGEWADGTAAPFAVTDAAGGQLLGACGLKLAGRAFGYGEVGYWTAPWARGQGAAGRAARLAARWGLDVLGLDRVELLADVENLPSQRAAERAGFVREGVARRSRPDRDGTARDMVLFSLVRSDAPVAGAAG